MTGEMPRKPMTPGEKTLRQAASLLVADAAGAAASIAVLSNTENLDKSLPGPTNTLKKFLKDFVIRPLRAPIEWVLKHTTAIEGKEDYTKRMDQTPEQRIDGLTETAFDYTLAILAGFGTMAATNQTLNHAQKVQNGEGWKVAMKDATIHAGTVAVMCSPLMSDITKKMKMALTCVCKSFGYDDKKAKDMANYLVAAEFPNVVTYLTMVGMQHHANLKEALHATSAKINSKHL